jgi:5-methyltetrahydropteroyltriglutamate--homocysteine methyltransferase
MKAMRVDHVGSLLRPEYLKDAFRRFAAGGLAEEALKEVQDRAIRDVLRRQESIGLPVLTDGEYRRLNWQVSFSEVEGWDMWRTSWDNFRRNEAKVTLMGPDRVAQMSDIKGSPYRERDEFLADVVRVQREMVGELVKAGCRYVQLDEPSYTGYVDPATLERMRASGEDPMENLLRAVDADNAVVHGFKDTTFGLHVCRGNRASMWHREGSYDAIAERLFNGLRFDRLLLEYDTARAGGFEPLRFIPKGVTVVLGLITTKTGRLESVDELTKRIGDAARFIPLEQLALSPQCGFASGIAGNLLTEEAQWRKLEVMMEAARRVWQ